MWNTNTVKGIYWWIKCVKTALKLLQIEVKIQTVNIQAAMESVI
jgi:hypothetical protein